MVCNLKCLFSIVGLGNIQIFNIHTQFLGIEPVKGMFCINKCRNATGFLCFSNGVDGQGGFPRGFRAIDFNDPAPGITANTQSHIKSDRPRWYYCHVFNGIVTQFHDGPFAITFFYFIQGKL